MQNRLFATRIDVMPIGAPRLSYSLSILQFDTASSDSETETTERGAKFEDDMTIYSRLRKGQSIPLATYKIVPYEKEIAELLLTEWPLQIKEVSQDKWQLTCLKISKKI